MPDIPFGIAAVIKKSIAKQVDSRWSTAGEMRDAYCVRSANFSLAKQRPIKTHKCRASSTSPFYITIPIIEQKIEPSSRALQLAQATISGIKLDCAVPLFPVFEDVG